MTPRKPQRKEVRTDGPFRRAMRQCSAVIERVMPLRTAAVLVAMGIFAAWLSLRSAAADVQPMTAVAIQLLQIMPVVATFACVIEAMAGRWSASYLGGAIMAVMVAAVLRSHGSAVDEVGHWMLANAEQAMGLALGLLLILWTWKLGRWVVPAGFAVGRDFDNDAVLDALPRRPGLIFRPPGLPPTPFTADQRATTAVHEVGHLLPYAMLACRPSNLAAHVHDAATAFEIGFRGRVTHESFEGDATAELLNWQMLVMLAGNLAEDVVFGSKGDGAIGDTASWMENARHYLACGFGGPYFNSGTDDAEVAINRAELRALREQQTRDLTEFLRVNVQLLVEIAGELGQVGTLDAERIEHHLSRVQFTPNIQPLRIGFVKDAAGTVRVETIA